MSVFLANLGYYLKSLRDTCSFSEARACLEYFTSTPVWFIALVLLTLFFSIVLVLHVFNRLLGDVDGDY